MKATEMLKACVDHAGTTFTYHAFVYSLQNTAEPSVPTFNQKEKLTNANRLRWSHEIFRTSKAVFESVLLYQPLVRSILPFIHSFLELKYGILCHVKIWDFSQLSLHNEPTFILFLLYKGLCQRQRIFS